MLVAANICKQYAEHMAKTIETVYKEIGKRIVAQRKRQNMSQEGLAARSDIDRAHIGFIEQGRRRPTLSTLYKLAGALEITLEQLFKGL